MLSRLSLHGFKSFSDRTEVSFGPGITAIVGPNGCGKSNLADALRWVLGEQNPRVLRSSKQQDMIFSGTQKRKAMGMAEVTLLFDGVTENSQAETEIGRRLTRDGTSEYKLNGKPVRWKDVVETLAGTGLSHTGYVVIGQGMVQELALGKPQDRRAWIEEASGVARVKLDKKDMESRLEAAETNLVRLDDLMAELGDRRSRLASDRDVALEYYRLSQERRDTELSMLLHQAEEEERKIASTKTRVEKCRSDLKVIEAKLPKMRVEKENLEQKCVGTEQALAGAQVSRDQALSGLISLEKRRDFARNQSQLLGRELESRAVRRTAIERDLAKISSEEKILQKSSAEHAQKLEIAQLALQKAEESRALSEASFKGLSEKVIALRQDVLVLASQASKYQKAREDSRRQLESKEKDLENLKEWVSSATSQIDAHRQELASLEEQTNLAAYRLGKARETLETLNVNETSLQEQFDKVAASEKSLGARLSGLNARKRLLTDLERSFEGYARGPRTILAARDSGTLEGIRGSVGELLNAPAAYIPALSAAIGGAAENIVVDREEAAKAAISLLKSKRSGRATFLPLNLIRPRLLNARLQSLVGQTFGVRSLLEVVDYPKELAPCAEHLLGRVVLAETVDIALGFMKASGWATRVVTLSGESLEPGGAITGGDAPRHEGLFRRRQELSEVTAAQGRLTQELGQVLERRKCLEQALRSVSGQLEKARVDRFTHESTAVRLEEALSRTRASMDSLKRQIAHRLAAAGPLEEEISKAASDLQDAVLQEAALAAEMACKETGLERLEEEMRSKVVQDEEISQNVRQLASDKEALDRDLSRILRRREGLSGERVSLTKSLQQEMGEMARQKSLMEQASNEESALLQEIQGLDAGVREIVEKIKGLTATKESLGARILELRQESEKMAGERTSAGARLVELMAQAETMSATHKETTNYLSREFGVFRTDTVKTGRLSRSAGLSKMESLDVEIKALGSVNLKAGQEYLELTDRINAITAEKDDVLTAIGEIHKARQYVEREIETRFTETFRQVSESFSHIFQDLFGGGKGALVLVDGSLGVEVVAQPPGRRQKNLNLLSGGERSLCGLALIFAILSAKPSPLIVLDEVDTALDEANVVRFSRFLKRYSEDTQFLVITHQKQTMEAADLLYGVTMEEPGVSRIFGMRLADAHS